ncbi:unnamed protein product [Musa hybrid cultivar]
MGAYVIKQMMNLQSAADAYQLPLIRRLPRRKSHQRFLALNLDLASLWALDSFVETTRASPAFFLGWTPWRVELAVISPLTSSSWAPVVPHFVCYVVADPTPPASLHLSLFPRLGERV